MKCISPAVWSLTVLALAAAPAVAVDPATDWWPPPARDGAGEARDLLDLGPPEDEPGPVDSPLERAIRAQRARQAPPTRDPLEDLRRQMDHVLHDLEDRQTGERVQRQQQEIAENLDTLIARLEQARQQQGEGGNGGGAGNGPGNAAPTSPMNESQIASGPGGGELHAADRTGRDWAELTPRQRKRILQSRSEDFPAPYRQTLEDYFRRLAESQDQPDPSEEE